MAASEGGFKTDALASTGDSVIRAFKILNGDATSMFQGDLMTVLAAGYVEPVTGVAQVAIAGVLVGVEYTNAEGQRVHDNKKTSTISRDDTVAYINVNPFQIYRIVCGTSDTNVAVNQDVIGSSFDLEFNAGNSSTGQSGMILDTGTGDAVTA